MLRTALFLLLAPLALSGLALAQEATVPVDGYAQDVARLEGVWTGEYACEATGRSGTLTFVLGAGATRAVAQLVMRPRATPEAPNPEPVVLALHIVDVDSATVRGVLAPYDDPEWKLPLETHFAGTLAGDRIEGAFDALPTTIDTIPASGRWWVARQRPLAPEL